MQPLSNKMTLTIKTIGWCSYPARKMYEIHYTIRNGEIYFFIDSIGNILGVKCPERIILRFDAKQLVVMGTRKKTLPFLTFQGAMICLLHSNKSIAKNAIEWITAMRNLIETDDDITIINMCTSTKYKILGLSYDIHNKPHFVQYFEPKIIKGDILSISDIEYINNNPINIE